MLGTGREVLNRATLREAPPTQPSGIHVRIVAPPPAGRDDGQGESESLLLGILLSVAELELKRTPQDRRLYALGGVGSLHFEGLTSRTATAQSAAGRWRIARRGFWRRTIEATDAAGRAVGQFEPRCLRRGGTLRWAGRELELRPASAWRERYAVVENDRELIILDGKGWGRRPVKVTVPELTAI